MTDKIVQGQEQRRVFTASRVIAVNEVVPSIFGVLFIEKASHGKNCVQVICTDIHASLVFFKSQHTHVSNSGARRCH